MSKLIAILNVIAWSGFWAFGYLALAASPEEGGRTVIALLLAALGGAAGIWAFLWIANHGAGRGLRNPGRSRPRYEADTELDQDLAH